MPNTMTVKLYVPAGEGGMLLRYSKSKVPFMLAELTPEVKDAIASKYKNPDGSPVTAAQLENSNGNVYSQVNFKNVQEAEQFKSLRGAKLVTLEIEAGRISPWEVATGPMKGQIRYNVPIRAVEIATVEDFNLFALDDGALTLPKTVRPRTQTASSAVADGAADAPAAPPVAATADETANYATT